MPAAELGVLSQHYLKTHRSILTTVLWPCPMSYGLVLCPMAVSCVLWPCPVSCGPVLCPMVLSCVLWPCPMSNGPVLCPMALSYVLWPCPMALAILGIQEGSLNPDILI